MMEDEGDSSSVTFSKLNSNFSSDMRPILNAKTMTEEQKAYIQSVFQKYDTNNDRRIDVNELERMLLENNDISHKIVKKLVKYSDKNNDGKIDAEEFADMLLDKNFKQLFGGYVKSYVDMVVPRNKRHKFKPVGRKAGTHQVDGSYEEGYSFCPPPVCMVLVSIFEIVCYVLNEHLPNENGSNNTLGIVADLFVYNPENRQECWRFLTYMFVHIGWSHLTVNLICQVFLGIPLELRNPWWAVLTVYTAGVVAGSVLTSIFDPRVFLAGASGGVYAILTAHLANFALNWQDMWYPGVQLFIYLIMIVSDVGTSIYNRYYLKDQTPIGYAAHFGGAIAGFLVGIWILKNVEPTKNEKYMWWVALVVYVLLMGTGVVLNIVWKGHFLPTT